MIRKGAYNFVSIEQLPGWNAVLGLQFESLVCNNLALLLKVLNLDRTLLLSASPYRQGETTRASGCQIDLLLQTRHTIYLIEIKRREQIGEDVVAEVQEKVHRLKVRRGMSVIPVLVYEGRLSKRIAADGYFANIICRTPFGIRNLRVKSAGILSIRVKISGSIRFRWHSIEAD